MDALIGTSVSQSVKCLLDYPTQHAIAWQRLPLRENKNLRKFGVNDICWNDPGERQHSVKQGRHDYIKSRLPNILTV
eukprot:jgi/Botrbrau1/15880/Bobra.40_1s0064.1